MAVNDPVAVRFSNESVRVAADTLCRAYYSAKAILAEWNEAGVSELFPDMTTAIIEDGAPADGRRQISGHDVHRVMEALAAVVNTLESLSAVNNQTHFQNAIKVAVNPRPRLDVGI